MFLPNSYKRSKIWATIDVECIEDANFGITAKKKLDIRYEQLIEEWMYFTNLKGCAFVLGSFARKYPKIIQKLSKNGIDIASHSLTHTLVYKLSFQKWKNEIEYNKKFLEDLTSQEVAGYRSPSWSMPFEKQYYETLSQVGYKFSSSYFPFKTYMYGNSINKKNPFEIYTSNGKITEIPIPKYILPFSGGFYMRILPYSLLKYFTNSLLKQNVKPVFYIHPYELMEQNLIKFFSKKTKKDMAFMMSFIQYKNTKNKLIKLLNL